MPAYPAALAEIVEDFRSISDRGERAEMLIQYADRFEEVPEAIAARPFPEDHRVPACESEAYVWAEPLPDGTLRFHFAVENPQGLSAMALASILAETLSGAPLEEVVALDTDIVFTLFGKDLSMGKGQGLVGIINLVRHFAAAHRAAG